MARVDLRLEKQCFGISAWDDTFYWDMRFVKRPFETAEYRLLYSRNKQQLGYCLEGKPALSSGFKQVLKSSAADIGEVYIHSPEDLILYKLIYFGLSQQSKYSRDIAAIQDRPVQ